MTSYTHQTAPTQFVEANGTRFAYRRFGNPQGVPIVLNQHFRGTGAQADPGRYGAARCGHVQQQIGRDLRR